MQKGSIKQHGNWWMLKYRADVLSNGATVRKDRYKKLAPIDRDHQARPDGSAPEKVRALADLEISQSMVNPVTSGDSLQSFLEAFLASGEGGRGHALNPTTRKSYGAMFNMTKPFLPSMELGLVRTQHIDKLLQDVAKADGQDRRAQTAYANLKNFLASAFRYAARKGLTEINPVRDAAIPKGNASDTHAYTLEEAHAIWDALKDPVSKLLVLTAWFTGLRTEELKGLRWEDYDGKVFHVRRAVVANKLVETKTDASKAPVPVVGIVQKALAQHRKRGGDGGYIFQGDTGNPLVIENVIRRTLKPELAEAGIPWHGFHAFRRGLGTYIEVNLRYPREAVKRILRHSTTDVTGQHYIKVSVEENRKILERVERDFLRLR